MNKKILLIEDDQIFANIYRNKLILEGFDVEVALDGESGLDMVRSYGPDAVLVDLMLPKLPGVEVIRKLRLETKFQQLPLIVLTNTYLTSAVQDAWKAGATRCLAKADCAPKQVIKTIRGVLGSNTATPNVHWAAVPGRPAPAAAPSHTEPDDGQVDPADQAFQAELEQSFLDGLPSTLAGLRLLLQGMTKAENESLRLQQILQLYKKVRTLTGNAAIVGMGEIAHMSDALEALLRELYEKSRNINPSTLRTVASAVDFLAILFERRARVPASEPIGANVLVVDDEAISRRALTYALEKAKLKPISVEDPLLAFQMLGQTKFDLIFLDVDMPNMNGFELCSKIRTLPAYKKTPVVFVTNLNDFESRTNSSMSGGNDFIGKPFLFMELAVKALVYIFRGRLDAGKA